MEPEVMFMFAPWLRFLLAALTKRLFESSSSSVTMWTGASDLYPTVSMLLSQDFQTRLVIFLRGGVLNFWVPKLGCLQRA